MDLKKYDEIRRKVAATANGSVETIENDKDTLTLLSVDFVVADKGVGISMGTNEVAEGPMKEMLGVRLWYAWVEAVMVALGRDPIIKAASNDLSRLIEQAIEKEKRDKHA